MSKIKNMKLRYKIGMGVATGAAVVAAGGAAFAYFTSTGNGTGQGSVGSAGAWTVTPGTVSGTIYPGQGSETLGFTVTNAGNGNQELQTLGVVIASKNGNITQNGTEKAGCSASWFHASIPTADQTPNVDMVPSGQTPGTGQVASYGTTATITMDDASVAQDACQGTTPDVTVSAA